jgi:hypothetical protein
VVLQQKSACRDPSEVKNIIGNLLHLALIEPMSQALYSRAQQNS